MCGRFSGCSLRGDEGKSTWSLSSSEKRNTRGMNKEEYESDEIMNLDDQK